jgi:hypothetical protein
MNKSEMMDMKLDGMTYADIAVKAGLSRQRIQQILAPPNKIRNIIIEKFNNRCNRCGIYVGKSGHVHHANMERPECYKGIENLELLCPACHRIAHKGTHKHISKNIDRDVKIATFAMGNLNKNLAEIGRVFNLSGGNISVILKGIGLKRVKNYKRDESIKLYKLQNAKATYQQIGDLFGIVPEQAWRIINKNGA